ncbi:MAG TPA: MBL fold metallo-hydrolase [Vicinamibacterales bacterium]|nr:MBL fold metallo-hydrolase [Vicinamibacterales bacterium]
MTALFSGAAVFSVTSRAMLSAQDPPPAGARGGRGAAANPIPDKTTLLLLGTQGGPGVGLMRAQTASIVFAGGQPYLVDCGYGTVRGLVQAGLRLPQISTVFVSHLHNDHTADIAALLSLQWTGGQANSLATTVWGPPGTQAMVEGAIAFFRGDTEIRTVDEGRTVKADTVFKGRDLSAPKVTEVFKDERVTVQAIENTHFPDRAKAKMAHRSFAYRFNAPDRSIVLSGDTAYSPGLLELARGADVLVCEAMTMANYKQLQGRQQGAGDGESIGRHVLETHSSTEDVGRMAAEAKVRTVVLYHLLGVPGPRAGGTPEDAFVPDVKKHFNGEVIVGNDQMRI